MIYLFFNKLGTSVPDAYTSLHGKLQKRLELIKK